MTLLPLLIRTYFMDAPKRMLRSQHNSNWQPLRLGAPLFSHSARPSPQTDRQTPRYAAHSRYFEQDISLSAFRTGATRERKFWPRVPRTFDPSILLIAVVGKILKERGKICTWRNISSGTDIFHQRQKISSTFSTWRFKLTFVLTFLPDETLKETPL